MFRFDTRADKGHEQFRIGEEHHGGRGVKYASVHRLAAYAWGILEDYNDPREVHHVIEVGWYNAEDNLVALEPEHHGRETRRREAERKGRAQA